MGEQLAFDTAPAVIMVDELRFWPGPKPRCFNNGSCHLTVDSGLGDLDALHAFAKRLGLKRAWFQNKRLPHYDLTASKRELALSNGAVFVPGMVQARARLAKKQAGEDRISAIDAIAQTVADLERS